MNAPRRSPLWKGGPLAFLAVASVPAQLAPRAPIEAELFLKVSGVATLPASAVSPPLTNATSPVVVGNQLVLVDQRGFLQRLDAGAKVHALFAPSDAPGGVTLVAEKLLAFAASRSGSLVYLVFTSTTVPTGTNVVRSPRGNATAFQVLFEYAFDGTRLTQPRPVLAFEVYAQGHTGGGSYVLDDGTILFAVGDNGDAGQDGLAFPQDATSHIGKLLRIDPATSTWAVVAKGLRNVQHIEVFRDGGVTRVALPDIGGAVAEELDVIDLADVVDPSVIENFGWGRNAVDGRAREGTFYIDPAGVPTGSAPVPEAGFRQPHAQFGRGTAALVAISGSVSRAVGLTSITSVFGDLVSGSVYASRSGLFGIDRDVCRVRLVAAADFSATTLGDLAKGRADPRFFTFPDGTAGVLLERTGALYRLEQCDCRAASSSSSGQSCGPESVSVEPPGARIGGIATVAAANGRANAAVLLLWDAAKRAQPLDLGFLGMTGCELRLSQPTDLVRGAYGPTGRFAALVRVPAELALCGAELFVQCLSSSPGANPAALTTSELLGVMLGL